MIEDKLSPLKCMYSVWPDTVHTIRYVNTSVAQPLPRDGLVKFICPSYKFVRVDFVEFFRMVRLVSTDDPAPKAIIAEVADLHPLLQSLQLGENGEGQLQRVARVSDPAQSTWLRPKWSEV